MKRFGSSLYGQAIKAAGVGAALMLSVSVGPCPIRTVRRLRRRMVRQRHGFTFRRHHRAHPLQGRLQGQRQRPGAEAEPALRQRQLQIRSDQRRHQPGRPDFRQLERGQPQHLRQSAGHRGRRPDRGVRRGQRLCRQPDLAHQRQQADRADQLQGRDQGRQHHDGEELTPHAIGIVGRDLICFRAAFRAPVPMLIRIGAFALCFALWRASRESVATG